MKHWKTILVVILVCLFFIFGKIEITLKLPSCSPPSPVTTCPAPPDIELQPDLRPDDPQPDSPPPPPAPTAPQGSRMLNFPEDHSLGEVYMRRWDIKGETDWVSQGNARGSLPIPKEMALKLVVGLNVKGESKELLPLASFPANTFDALVLIGDDVTNTTLSSIKGLTGLKSIKITSRSIDDNGFSHIENMTNLRTLEIAGLNITDAGLEVLDNFQNLQTLEIKNSPITNGALDYIKKLKLLRALTVSNTKLSAEGLLMLKYDMNNLQTVKLNGKNL